MSAGLVSVQEYIPARRGSRADIAYADNVGVDVDSSFTAKSKESVHASVAHLLTRAYMLPCSTAAMAFVRLVPETGRFQLALDELFPLLSPDCDSVCLSIVTLIGFIS